MTTLTRDHKEGLIESLTDDPEFARVLLAEAAGIFLNGEADMARLMLQVLVDATVGFDALAETTSIPSDRLREMLSSHADPQMDLVAAIFSAIRTHLGATMLVRSVAAGSEQDEFESLVQTRPDAA